MPVPGLKLTPTLLANLLKSKQLRALASSLGTPISGTKKVLAEGVCAALGRSRFPKCSRSEGGGNGDYNGDNGGNGEVEAAREESVRILSVDMGIRNLAVCLLEVPQKRTGGGEGGEGKDSRGEGRDRDGNVMVPSVIAWQKMSIPPTTGTTTTSTTTNKKDNKERNETPPPTTEESTSPEELPPSPPHTPLVESFSASTFSHHAYNLAITLLHLSSPTCLPDQILIETQRYRSSGRAAVQEWTLRVNMLENMLWGCLRTLAEVGIWGAKSRSGEEAAQEEEGGEIIEGVNPLKVVGFWEGWLAGNGVPEVERRQTAYAESKKSKTRIVRGLLEANPCTESSSEEEEISVPLFQLGTDQARKTAGLFLEANGNGVEGAKKPRKQIITEKRSKKQPKGKLDDLADCLLQGLAWVKWEEGRRKMVSGEGVLAGVDIKELVEKGRGLVERGAAEEEAEGEGLVQKLEQVKRVRKRRKMVGEVVSPDKEGVVEAEGQVLALQEEMVTVERKIKEAVEVAVKRKRRTNVKKISTVVENEETIPSSQEIPSQEIPPPQEVIVKEVGHEVDAEPTYIHPSLVPILQGPVKKRGRPRKALPPGEGFANIPPLGMQTTVVLVEGKEVARKISTMVEREETIPSQPVFEKEAELPAPEVELTHTLVPILQQPVRKRGKPRKVSPPPEGFVYVTRLEGVDVEEKETVVV